MAADGSITIDTSMDTKEVLKTLKSLVKNIEDGLTDAEKASKKSFKQIVATADTGLKQMSKVANVALAGIAAGLTALGAAFVSVVKNASAIENATAQFTPLLGSVEKATDLVNELNKTAASTPFQFENIANVANKLLPSMNGNIKKTIDTFRFLGDTAGGSAEKLTTITNGYSKALLKGKVDLESLNMIAEAGVPIFDQMATEIGVSTASLFEMVSAGKVTTSQLTNTFRTMTSEGGIFYNGMEIASQTLTGLQSTLTDNIKLTAAAIGNNLIGSVKDTTKGMIGLVQSFEGVDGFTDKINEMILKFNDWAFANDGLKDSIKRIVSFIKTGFENGVIPALLASIATIKLMSGAMAILNGVMASNPIALVTTAIIGLSTALLIATEKQTGFLSKFKESRDIARKLADGTAEYEDKLRAVQIQLDKNGKQMGSLQAARDRATDPKYKKKWQDQIDALRAEMLQQDILAETIKYEIRVRDDLEKKKQAEIALIAKEKQEKEDLARIEREKQLLLELTAQIEEETAKQREKLNENALAEADKVLLAQEEQALAQEILSKQLQDNYITQEEHSSLLMSSYDRLAETLYGLGFSADEFGEMGDQALFKILQRAKELQKQLDSQDLNIGSSEGVGVADPAGLAAAVAASGVEDPMTIFDQLKYMASEAATGIKAVFSSDIFGDVLGAIVKGVKVAISITSALISEFFDAVSFLAGFTTAGILETLDNTLTGLSNFFLEGGDLYNVSNMFQTAIDWIGDFVDGLMDNKDLILDEIDNIFANISKSVSENKGVFKAIGTFLGELVVVILENLPEFIESGLEILGAVAEGILENIDEMASAAVEIVVSIINYITENLSEIIEVALLIVMAIATGILENLPAIIDAVVEIIPAVIIAIIENLPLIVESILKLIPMIIVALALAIPTLILAVVDAMIDVMDAIKDGITDAPDIAKDMIDGMVEGITTAAAKMWDSVKSVFSDFVDSIKDFFGIHSPSTVFSGFGDNMIQGLIDGILDAGASLWDSVSSVFSGFLENLGDIWDSANDIFGNITDAAAGVVSSVGDVLSSAVDGAVDGVTGLVSDTIDGTKNVASAAGDYLGISDDVSNAIDGTKSVASSVASSAKSAAKKVSSFFGFASGSPYIEEDQIAQIHQGERIIPKTFNESIMSGETMMLSSEAFSSIMAGLSGGMGMPNVGQTTTQAIQLTANITGLIEADGREIARTSFQYIDEFAGVAYGS